MESPDQTDQTEPKGPTAIRLPSHSFWTDLIPQEPTLAPPPAGSLEHFCRVLLIAMQPRVGSFGADVESFLSQADD